MDELPPSGESLDTGWGMSLSVLNTVTSPLILVALVELLMKR